MVQMLIILKKFYNFSKFNISKKINNSQKQMLKFHQKYWLNQNQNIMEEI